MIRYVALGDSYTIGTGTSLQASWPAVVTEKLKANRVQIKLIANLAQAGWTTQNLIDHQLPAFEKVGPTFATLLIGANDVVRGYDKETFRQSFVSAVDKILKILPDKTKLLIITVPDFSVSPQAAQFGSPIQLNRDIQKFNAIIKEEADNRNLHVFDLFLLSQTMRGDSALFSSDGLHPSAKGYALWASAIYSEFKKMLKK